jgi:hypothetical protein
MQPRPPGRRWDLNARALRVRLNASRADGRQRGRDRGRGRAEAEGNGAEEIDDLYRREVMDSGPRLRRA